MNEYEAALSELVAQGIMPSEQPKQVEKSSDELIIDEISRITGVAFSEEQRRCLMQRGSCVILACAGSGKTSVLTNMLTKRIWNREILDTRRVICTTYSKAGADEMNVRLKNLLNTVGIQCELEVRTLHSFFYMLIKTFGMDNFKVIAGNVRSQYIKEACKDAKYICKDDDLIIIDNLLSYRVNNLLNDNMTLASPACTIADLSVEQFRDIRKGYDLRKSQNNYIDFDDMQLYLYKWLCKDIESSDEATRQTGEAVRNYCRALYDEFYIDEAQDVSKIQYEIVKSIVTDRETGKLDKTLVFMGDDDQCIYKWRGAAPEIILKIGATMNIGNYVLSTNYRCKNEIVDFAHRSIKYNSSRYNKGMTAYQQGGEVYIHQAVQSDLYELSKIAVAKVKDLLNAGYRKSDIALLCRNNAHLSIVNIMLLEDGIYSNIPSEMKLTKTYIYTDIKNIIMLAGNGFNGNVTAQVLWKLCQYMTVSMSRQIGDFQKENGLTLVDTLKWICENTLGLKDVTVGRQLIIDAKTEQKMKYCMVRIKPETIVGIQEVLRIMGIASDEERTNALITQYLATTDYMYKNMDKNRNLRGLVHYIQDMIRKKGFTDTVSYLRTVEQLESSDFVVPKDSIRMSTIHGAKGREWPAVILFACDNEAMPGISGISKMIDNNLALSDIYDSIDEERRLYYVACTRAKEHLDIVTGPHPSVFLLESLGEYRHVQGDNNAVIMELASAESLPTITIAQSRISNKEIEMGGTCVNEKI